MDIDQTDAGKCEARLRERYLTQEMRMQGLWFHDLPVSQIRYDAATTTDVCGINLCWRHREMVTEWRDGEERLQERLDSVFASWGLERRGPFFGLLGARAAIANLVRAIQVAEATGALQSAGETEAWFTFKVSQFEYDASDGTEDEYDGGPRMKTLYRSEQCVQVVVDVVLAD